MSDIAKVCIDRILPRDLMRLQPTTRGTGQSRGRSRAIAPIGKTWPNGSRLKVRFIGGTEAQRQTARSQAAWWSDVANIGFDFGTASNAELRIAFDSN
ncbi:MAG: peptidase, partial [Gemmatimonadaceae bacterium]